MKTTSLELSKRIAELEGGNGVSESQWRIDWIAGDGGIEKEGALLVHGENYETKGTNENGQTCGTYLISAYTTDELSDLLPYMIEKKPDDNDKVEKWFLSIHKTELNWLTRYTWYYYEPMDDITQQAETMVESMGLMYEHLLKEGIIKSN